MNSVTPRKAKPNTTPWLSQVPEHWEVKRLKYALSLSNDRLEVDQDESLPYVGMENIESWTGRLLPLDEEFIPTGTSNRFSQGQVLFGKLRPYLAKATIADRSGVCSTELMVFEPKEFDNRFLLYLILSDGFIKLVDSSTQGSKMPRADWEFIGNIEVAYPPLSEQRAIAAYLDERTARIDGLVARQRRLVELLKEKRQALITRAVTRGLDPNAKMKDSGVPWLGEVPEGWTLRPLKQLVAEPITDGPHETPEFHDEGVPFVSAEAVWDGRIHLESIRGHITRDDNERYSKKYFPRRNDIYIVKSGSTTGRVAIVDFDTEFNIWSPLAAIRCNDQLSHYRFIYHALASDYFQKQVQTRWSFGTQPNIGMNVIGNLLVALPPRREQQELADYIDSHAIHLDTLVTKIEQAIERLQEYRTALISAAVTGKVRVPQ